MVVRPNGEEIAFVVDPVHRHLLLNGLDDIGQTLQHQMRSPRSRPGETARLGDGDCALTTKSLLVLAGDGVGPEVVAESLRVLEQISQTSDLAVELHHGLVGGASIEANGAPLTEDTLSQAKAADAVLFGAVGGPQWDKLGFDRRPEIAILSLRRELGLFANLRPAIVFDPLVDASTLKPQVVKGLDLMIVRESTGGIYFGEPRGIQEMPDGGRRGVNTEVYTTQEIERVARVAFELAGKRQARVTSVEKANVMESGLLWRETVQALRDQHYPDLALAHMYADNCAIAARQKSSAI